MNDIKENIIEIKSNINRICNKNNLNKNDITLIAVTKTMNYEKINYAIENGIADIGENKVQEVMDKYDLINKNVNWHLIGHLQTNKVKYIIDKVKLIHSVDSLLLAQEINKRAAKMGIIKDILIQVNVAMEATKFGISTDEVDAFIEQISLLSNVRIKGLMTIAPLFDEVEKTRPIFRALREKRDEIIKQNIPSVEMNYLSMGMSGDYSIAIEEGSNMIRVGTGIFGKRDYNI